MDDKIKQLKQIKEIQCNDGNWDFDPYMHGMANGLIMALSIFEGTKPEFLEPPKRWRGDIPVEIKPTRDPSHT